jgi:hypothetical protein
MIITRRMRMARHVAHMEDEKWYKICQKTRRKETIWKEDNNIKIDLRVYSERVRTGFIWL